MTAEAPILLVGSYGELDVFASVTEAERAIDPWALTDTGSSEPEQIRAKLAERLREDGSLDLLVKRAVERFGYRR